MVVPRDRPSPGRHKTSGDTSTLGGVTQGITFDGGFESLVNYQLTVLIWSFEDTRLLGVLVALECGPSLECGGSAPLWPDTEIASS